MTEQTYISRAGHKKLRQDIEELKKRKAILSIEIGEAREKGDLKENAEYHSAKERLTEIMGRIARIENELATARLVDEIDIQDGQVQIGVRVTLRDKEDNEEYAWTLVGQTESDPAAGKISVHAPLAQGILGHKVGEEVAVTLPAGERTFLILKTEPAA